MREWWNSLSEALSIITTFVGTVVLMASWWAVVWTWVQDWDWVQKSMAIIVALALFFLLVLAVYTWWRKYQIYKIPNLLYKLDEMLKIYVDNYDISRVSPTDKAAFGTDLAELMHINIWTAANAVKTGDRKKIADQTQRYVKNYNALIDPANKSNENLKTLMQMCGLMNQHGIGLKTIQDTPNYSEIKSKVLSLRRIVPNPEVNIKINNYFNWSDGLYSLLICQKWVVGDTSLFALSPAEYKAISSYTKPVTEGNIDVLIADVAQSLSKGKSKRTSQPSESK